jgi:amidase
MVPTRRIELRGGPPTAVLSDQPQAMGPTMAIEMRELASFDAIGLAEEVRRGRLAAAEVLETTIAAIDRLNPRLNAVISKLYDEAHEQIRRLDPQRPFAGVPFLAKDLFAEIGGTPLHEGSAFLQNRYRSSEDSELAARWREAGLVIVGKTNTPEFGLKPDCEPRLYGPTINPWAPGRTTGGSSGGSAAAVAARLVPMAHANDAGGSIRVPASCCGLFGLKPTRARNPMGPFYGDAGSGIVSEHAITRSVRDSALLLDVTARLELGEPYYAPRPETSFLSAASRPPGALRIGMVTEPGGDLAVESECLAACQAAGKLLEELGHRVEDAGFTHDAMAYHRRCVHIFSALTNWAIKDWSRRTGREISEGDFEPFTWFLYERGQKISSGDYLLIVQDMHRYTRDIARFFERFDVMLTPTMMMSPPELGYLSASKETIMEMVPRLTGYTFFTFIANGAGLPSASLPLHWTAQGLPVGVLATAAAGREELLFSLAAQVEAARPWATKVPPICA